MKTLKILAVALLVVFAGVVKAHAPNPAVSQLIKAYLGIKGALAADNSKGATTQAKLFTDALKEVNASKLDAAKKAVWTKYAEKLRFNGEHINESQDIEHQREHFQKLSDDFYAALKAMKANDVVLYRQYCPMKKAYWLSDDKAVINPYYGKEMLECGMVRETLNAN